ncbi:MAG: sucrase ferredoxin [Trueperaceae bacterium]
MSVSGGSEPYLCNLFARERGLDPIGYAGALDAFLAFEVPLPWPRGIFESRTKLPREVRETIAWFTREAPYRLRPLVIGPDPQYSVPGERRVIWYSRPTGPFAVYERSEYLVPKELMGELVAALIRGRGSAESFREYRRTARERDLLICTHGSQDAACGRYGVPLYRRLRMASPENAVRVWRVSHFGGHVFAPTVLELPSARSWAYLEDESGDALLHRRGDPEELRGNYRGWAALESPFLQALERELLVHQGWGWLDVPKSGEVLEQDDAPEPKWAEVRIHAWHFDSHTSFRGRVEVSGGLQIRPRSDSPELKPYAQFRVARMDVDRNEAAGPAVVET